MTSTGRPLARSFLYSVGIYVVFNGLFLALVFLKPGTHYQFVIADDIGQAVGWLLGTLLCFVGFEMPWKKDASRSHALIHHCNAAFAARLRLSSGERQTTSAINTVLRWVPVFFAAGIFSQFIGQVIYTSYDILGWKDFPSVADAGYLSTFPFLLIGVLLLPIPQLVRTTRSRVILDGFMIMTAAVTFSWYFVLGPTMFQGNEGVFAEIVGSAYPFFDLVLIFCVLRLTIRSHKSALWPAIQLLALGLIIIVITDSIYDYQTLRGIYVNGWQDAGWPLGYMLIGLAVQFLNMLHVWRKNATTDEAPSSEGAATTNSAAFSWYSILPFALIPAVIALGFYVWQGGQMGPLAQGVYLGGAILVGLVILRQFLVFRKMIYYTKQLSMTQQELNLKNQALSEANGRLEEQATQLETAYEQQLHLNELKDQFLLNVNHELRTPLTELHGYLNLLTEYKGQIDQEMQAIFVNHALHGSEELLQLVSNVLDAIRGDVHKKATQLEDLPLSLMVEEAVAVFDPQKRGEYSLALNIPETLIVWADRQYLHQVLLNLLSNVFKYSPQGTSIAISAALPETANDGDGQNAAQTRVGRATARDRPYNDTKSEVCICVQDTGPGIPPSEIPLLFGKFVRLERDLVGSVRGTGLGLYITKQLVEGMEGRIWVESTGIAGEGSRFYFTLPRVLRDAQGVSNQGVINQGVINHTRTELPAEGREQSGRDKSRPYGAGFSI